MKQLLQTVNNRVNARNMKIFWKKFLEQFESPSTRNYKRWKNYLAKEG